MKKLTGLILCLATLVMAPAFAQPAEKAGASAAASAPKLSKFNLDFPGGTPRELGAAIQKALGRPLNLVVADEYAAWNLPPLKMNSVDAVQLFRALEMAGQTREIIAQGNGGFQQTQSNYGFKDSGPGAPNDDTIWSFYVNSSPRMPKVSRFYLLTPYLEGGLTVNDITTAIQTGWKLRGDVSPPTLSFHKETKLLIAVGEYGGLDTIDQVLKALDAVKAKPAAEKSAGEPKTKS